MVDLVPTNGDFPAVPSHDVRYIQYNIFGNLFEITNKYRPPVMPIGRGAYGILCLVLNSETKGMVAIKKIANAFDNHMDAKRTLREIKLLRHLDHENVIAIKDVIPPPLRREFSDVYIAMELMNTDLHQIIRSNRGLSEEHRQYFLYQILRGLKYIHSANVIHRDLKPSNLVLNANCDLKICDFGLACPTAKSNKNGLGLLLLSTSLSCFPPSSATVTTILNLSQIEENKAAIGRSGAIPLLVNLLECGGFCRKKDASTALYSFCSAKENKIRVVESGIMKPLVELMANFRSNMVDKSAYVGATIS